MLQIPRIRRSCAAVGAWVCITALIAQGPAAQAQTELSLQETQLNVTADHSGNVVVNIHVDSIGANAAVYGIVGKPNQPASASPPQGPVLFQGPAGNRQLAMPTIVSAGAADWDKPHVPDELIVCYNQQWLGGMKQPVANPAMRQQKNALHDRMKSTLRKELRSINADVIKVPQGKSLEAVAEQYAREPGVSYVQPSFIYKAIGLPDDPNFPNVPSSLGPPDDQLLWGLHTTAADGANIPFNVAFDSDIDAAEAWEVTTGNTDVVVAVIDTGVDYTHPDLAGNMWTNPGEINGNGIDDDSNGYIDDYYGYDFKNDDGDPFDDHYHGTHVSGTIGAVGNNGIDIAGVCWDVRIMGLKFLHSDGFGSTADAVDAVDYASMMGVPLSNNSWGGGGFDPALYAAIQNAGANGHLFLAAAGNDAFNTDITPHYPSTYDLDNIVSVAASDKNELLADFSNYGAVTTDLAAPGVGTYSLAIGGGIFSLNGTSMATPHVSGVAALLKTVRPAADPLQIKQWILDGVTPHPNLTGKVLTGGRLNAVEPLRLATMPWLRVDNREGILDAGNSLTIPVTFVTQNNPVGFYSGSLIVLDLSYDTAATPRIEIPVTMDLQFVELPPVVDDVHQFVIENFDATITLIGSDPNIGQTVDFTIESLPALGTLTDPAIAQPIASFPYTLANGANQVTYSPAPDQLYIEDFTFTATDGNSTSNIGTVEVEVVDRPQPPQDVNAVSGNTFVDLNWLPNTEPELVGYNVFQSTSAGGPYNKITPTPNTGTSYRHYPGGPITNYYVVTAVLSNGAESDYSAEVSGTPTFISQHAPQNLRGTAAYEKVYLEWDPPQEFLGTYRIIRSLAAGGGDVIVGELDSWDETTFVDINIPQWGNGPENGVTYNYYVENYTYWDLWGSNSNTITATPDEDTPPSAPTGVAAVGGQVFVDVTWDANPELDIDEYQVLRATTSGGPYFYQGAVTDRRFFDTAVSPGTTYYYAIIAFDLDGEESDLSAEVSAVPIGDQEAPAAPTNLITITGDGFVNLDWDDNSEPDLGTYNIYRATTQGGPYQLFDQDDPSEYQDGDVINGTTYYYVVTALDTSGNESAYSNEASATPNPDLDPPAAPTNLVATPGAGVVTLDWDDNTEPDLNTYFIYRSTTSGGPYTLVDNTDPSFFQDGSVSNGTTYYYVVTAEDSATNQSAYSNEASATPMGDVDPPAAPTNLIATPGDGVVSLDWDDNIEPDLNVYFIYRSTTPGGPYVEVDNDDPSFFQDGSVTNGTTYYYVVTAQDVSGNESGYSNDATATPMADDPPAAPANLAATPGDGVVSLDWDDNSEPDLDYYSIYRSLTSGGPYGEIDNDNPSQFQDNFVTNGITYFYVVTAWDLAGNESGYSNEVSATPADTTLPAPPANLGAIPADGLVTLDWDDNTEPDLQTYFIYRSTTSGGPYTELDNDTPSNYADFSVTNFTTYYYVVTAKDTVGNESVYSNEASATPAECFSDADCDDGLYCNGVETCVNGVCQPGTDPCNGDPCNEATDQCEPAGGPALWLSFKDNASVPGVGTAADEDIVALDVTSGQWSMIFDGSDVGLAGLEIDGFAVLPGGDIIMSFTAPGSVPGLSGGPSGASVDDSDIVQFTPTSLGANTAGSFTFLFDGSDVGLSSSSEDIDAIGLMDDGRIVISTTGNINANGASGADEDLWIFNDTSLGASTSGSFERLFDGGDVGLSSSSEDTDAVGLTLSGNILLSTTGNFSVSGLSGSDEDIAEFTPTQLGDSTSGSFDWFVDLSAEGISSAEDVGGLEMIE